jgi:beta-glucosidase
MDLPGRQSELVEQVVAANTNTVVVVNAGSPVTMDWAGDDHAAPAPAIVTSFFAGQEQAEALVDVLFGDADPGGRLPTTYPKRLADHPAVDNHIPDTSGDGPPVQRYAEGLFIGHRHYERAGVEPRFWFGHGLSYGAAAWGAATADRFESATSALDRDPIVISLPISATSDRAATVVVQCYVAPVDAVVERPARVLKAWTKLTVAAGANATATMSLGSAAFHHWDESSAAWLVSPGTYDVVVAPSSSPTAEHQRLRVTLHEPSPGNSAP